MLALQYEVKMEHELVQMYGMMFEEQLKTKLPDCCKQYIELHLKYLSDMDFFKYED